MSCSIPKMESGYRMGQRSDAKAKMITAARQLIRERGYHATAMSDVVELSEAPRGSVYFHFPGGKTQLAVAAAEAYARDQADQIEHAAEHSNSVVDLVNAHVGRARDNLVKAGYTEGCTVAPLVLEGARESDELVEAGRAAFSTIIESLAFQFAVFGMGRAQALELAEVVVIRCRGRAGHGSCVSEHGSVRLDTHRTSTPRHPAQRG